MPAANFLIFERCLKIKIPVIKVEMIANSKLALTQGLSRRPKPQKKMDIEMLANFWTKYMAQARTEAVAAPTIEESETYLVFLRVIPNVRKLKIIENQLVEKRNPV